ncbi:MAG TPA: glycosyltransferase, partial [Alphaproteobacteria bacterium]|nr:glycosyltransferase [Alphaproteobacteria bacterium]
MRERGIRATGFAPARPASSSRRTGPGAGGWDTSFTRCYSLSCGSGSWKTGRRVPALWRSATVLHSPVERIVLDSSSVKVSVVVPSIRGGPSLARLLETLRGQDCGGLEVLVVKGVSPQGRAINMGVAAARGGVIVVCDDDSRLPYPSTVRRLVEVLEADPKVGMVGAATRCDPALPGFARAVARSIPRFEVPVVQELTDSDMACHG